MGTRGGETQDTERQSLTLGVGHSYKWQLVKSIQFSKNLMNLYEGGRTN